MRIIILLLLCFFMQICKVSGEELLTNRMRKFHKNFFVLLPEEFKPSGFSGFSHESVESTVMLEVIPESFDTVDLDKTYLPYLMEKRQTMVSEEILKREDGKAKLYYMSYKRLGMNLKEWVLISGNDRHTFILRAVFLKAYEKEFKQMLRMCVLSLTNKTAAYKHKLDLMITNSKIEKEEEEENKKIEENNKVNRLRKKQRRKPIPLSPPSRWKKALQHEMSYVYTVDGVFPVESNYKSVFVVAPSTHFYNKENKLGSARKAVRGIDLVQGVEILDTSEIILDDMEGYQFIIRGHHVETLEPTKALATVLFEEDMYYILLGYVSERYFSEDVGILKEVTDGFQRIHIEKTGETEALLEKVEEKVLAVLSKEDIVVVEKNVEDQDVIEERENKKILKSIEDFKLDPREEKAIIKWLER